MAMDATRLGNAMYDAVHNLSSGSGTSDAKARMTALAGAIISEITSNAQVSTNVTTTVTGTCPGSGGPLVGGAGTGSGEVPPGSIS